LILDSSIDQLLDRSADDDIVAMSPPPGDHVGVIFGSTPVKSLSFEVFVLCQLLLSPMLAMVSVEGDDNKIERKTFVRLVAETTND
jgi:hypothetical protein